MTAKLELKAVRKLFDGVAAVDRLDIALEQGQFLSLLGPSGCGKSTTLNMIAGFESPDEGTIAVDGRSVHGVPVQKRGVGLVFQDYAVFTRLSVAANLEFGLAARGVPRRQRRSLVADMASKLELTGLLRERGSQLNMSEMQRVALARVLITTPALLLLDEPMSNLDAATRSALRGELKQIQRELGQSVLYVTHDQVEAMSMSDRIAVMRAGKLMQVGSPEEIYHRPVNRFVAEFIGDPPINVVPCEVQVRDRRLVAATPRHRELQLGRGDARAGEYLLGIRPHHFQVRAGPNHGAVSTRVRLVENFGAEHVLHVEYGEDLVAVSVPPRLAREGDTIHLAVEASSAHLFEPGTGATVPIERSVSSR